MSKDTKDTDETLDNRRDREEIYEARRQQNQERIDRIKGSIDPDVFDLWETALSLPAIGKSDPKSLRYTTEQDIPGLTEKLNKHGQIESISMDSMNEFAEFLIARYHITNMCGLIAGWDDDGHRVLDKDKIIDLAIGLAYDVINSPRMYNDVFGTIQHFAPKVDIDEVAPYTGFTNGVLNTETGEWTPDPEAIPTFFTIPHEYHPEATVNPNSTAYQFLYTLADQRDDIFGLLTEVVGVLLSASLSRREIPLIVSEGQHGKSTFLNAMSYMLGRDNVANTSVERLGDTFGMQDLIGKSAMFADDMPSDVLSSSTVSMLKLIGSHETATVNRKYLEAVNVRLMCNVIMTSNTQPRMKLRDANSGVWERLAPVPFNADFSDNGTYKRIPNMRAILHDETFLEDLISIGVNIGLPRLRANEWRFTKTSETQKLKLEGRKDSDNVARFIDEVVAPYTGHGAGDPLCLHGFKVSNVYETYLWFCDRARDNSKPLSRRAFTQQIHANLTSLDSKLLYIGNNMHARGLADSSGSARFFVNDNLGKPDEVSIFFLQDFATGTRDAQGRIISGSSTKQLCGIVTENISTHKVTTQNGAIDAHLIDSDDIDKSDIEAVDANDATIPEGIADTLIFATFGHVPTTAEPEEPPLQQLEQQTPPKAPPSDSPGTNSWPTETSDVS